MNGTVSKSDKLSHGKQDSNSSLDANKKAGSAMEICQAKDRWLKVEWDKSEVYCADKAFLNGTAAGIDKTVNATAGIKSKDQPIASLNGKGQNSFKIEWKVCGVAFQIDEKTKKMPGKLPVEGNLSADGLITKTSKALEVRRLPDMAPDQVSFTCSSPKSVNSTNNYSWEAKFKLGVESGTIKVQQTLQILKAWLGKMVSFDPRVDKLGQTWGYIKKSGTDWKYWNTTNNKWEELPRNVSSYSVRNLIFVQRGSSYISRDDDGKYTWPESFSDAANYEDMKKVWLKNIHDEWDRKFKICHKDCTGAAPGLCQWDISVTVNWSSSSGDKLVYAVWAADWERSNAKDWYLTETRLGLGGHECGHLLGAYDEYTGGAIHPTTKKIENDSIMGQNLHTAKPRHLDGIRDEIKKKIKLWIGRDWELEVKDL